MLKRMKVLLCLLMGAMLWPLLAAAQPTSCLTDDPSTNQVENTCLIEAVAPDGAWPRALTTADCSVAGTPFGDPSECRECGGTTDCVAWEVNVLCSESQDHLAFFVSDDIPVLGASPGPSPTFFDPGDGDNKGNGVNMAHLYGIRVNSNNDIANPMIITPQASPVPSSLVASLGRDQESCKFALPGDLSNPFEPIQPKVVFDWKGCGLEFGKGQGQVTSGDCQFLTEEGNLGSLVSQGAPLSTLELSFGGKKLGLTQFGSEGANFGTGSGSCSEFVFFGRVYVVVTQPSAGDECPCEVALPCGDEN
jgi:hypothetical protein